MGKESTADVGCRVLSKAAARAAEPPARAPPSPPDPPPPTTHAAALALFARHPTPRLILTVLAGLAVGRASLGVPLSPTDAAAFTATAAAWALQEPLLHAALHAPFAWPGRAIHEAHHALPYHHVSIDGPG